MTTIQHLLIKLAEECGEVAKECHKAALFGIHDKNPEDPHSLPARDRLAAELNDLVGVVSLLAEAGIIPRDWQSDNAIAAKRRKVMKWMKYARKSGTLRLASEAPPPAAPGH